MNIACVNDECDTLYKKLSHQRETAEFGEDDMCTDSLYRLDTAPWQAEMILRKNVLLTAANCNEGYRIWARPVIEKVKQREIFHSK